MEVFLLQNTTLQFFVFSDPTCSGKVVFAEAEPAHGAAAGQGLGHERQGRALQSAHLHYDAVHEGSAAHFYMFPSQLGCLLLTSPVKGIMDKKPTLISR